MKVCYTRKKENDRYCSDPNPQPKLIVVNPDNQLEFAIDDIQEDLDMTQEDIFSWLELNGYQPRLVDDVIVESWIEVAQQKEAELMAGMGL